MYLVPIGTIETGFDAESYSQSSAADTTQSNCVAGYPPSQGTSTAKRQNSNYLCNNLQCHRCSDTFADMKQLKIHLTSNHYTKNKRIRPKYISEIIKTVDSQPVSCRKLPRSDTFTHDYAKPYIN